MSRDLSDIHDALAEAKSAAESLMNHQRGVDGRDYVRSMQWIISRGMEAYERLRRDLRDGRKHIDYPDDEPRGPRAANLTEPSEGCRLCDACEGVGVTMIAVYEGGAHCEKDDYCPDCNGDGEVEVEEQATDASARAQRTNNNKD